MRAAVAGSYTVTYSGGRTRIIGPTWDETRYYSGTGSWSGGYYSATGGGSKFVSSESSGVITTTFTWDNGGNADDLPPKCVVIKENAAATWSVSSSAVNGQASGGHGLSSTVIVINSSSSSPTSGGIDATGWRVVNNPGAQFSIYASPNGKGSGSTPPYYGYVTAGSSVTYNAVPYPVWIDLAGVNKVSRPWKVLTGQQVTATIMGLPLAVKTPAAGVNLWTVGTNVFKDYTYNALPCVVVPLSDDDLRSPVSVSFYTKISETLNVKFKADLIVPVPAGAAMTLPVEVLAEPLQSLKPQASWVVNGDANVPPTGTTAVSFKANETWRPVTTTVPAPFSGGQVCFAQLIKPVRENKRRPLNGKPDTYYLKLPVTNADGSTSWVVPGVRLDTAFPYPGAVLTDSSGNPIPDSNGNGQFKVPPIWNVGEYVWAGDSPSQPYKPRVDHDQGGTDWIYAKAADQFDTWLMYMPPKVGSQNVTWVPLQKLHWSWYGEANKVMNSDPESWTVSPHSRVSPDRGTDETTHPTWDIIIKGWEMRP